MPEAKTHFAQLLNLLGIRPRDLCAETGAHKTLVSNWMHGKRKMTAANRYVQATADLLLERDARLKEAIIPEVLGAYYPEETLNAPQVQRDLLLQWLETVGYLPSEQQQGKLGLVGLVLQKVARLTARDAAVSSEAGSRMPLPMKNAVVYGVEGVQGSALQFIDLIMAQKEPQDVLYACPEGLDMYTRDERFAPQLMDALMRMFAAGHRLHVVLRTDFKMSDVSAFSGRWLVAHLLGYVSSYYFDDFHSSYRDKMLAVIKNRMAMKITDGLGEDRQGMVTAILFDAPSVENVWRTCAEYRSRAKQRFHYHLFEQSDGFLRGIEPLPDRIHYRFSRIPHFVLPNCVDRLGAYFGLNDAEIEKVRRDFGSLMAGPECFEAPVRHVFCEQEIEDALLKNRHVVPELSAIVGRRVFMTTQVFVDQLLYIKRLLTEQKHYDVCFLPDAVFQELTMQIACWGDRAAIGWIAGGKSTACRDYTNVNALTGFCEMIWDRIPGVAKSRRTALRKLNTWLKKAEKYGYSLGRA